LFPYTVSVAVLAGFGMTYLSGNGRQTTSAQSPFAGANTQRIIGWPIFWAGVAGLVLLIAALPLARSLYPFAERAVRNLAKADGAFESGRMFFMYQWRNLFVFALMLVASGAVLRVSRCPIYLPNRLGGYAVWKPLAVVVVAIDLFIAGYGFNPAADPRWLDFTPPEIVYLKARQGEDPHFRVTSYNAPGDKTLNANGPWLYDVQDVRGYGSIISKQYADYMGMIYNQYELLYNRIAPLTTDQPTALDSPLLDLLNVRYVVTTQEIESFKYELVNDGELRIYENKACMPRAFTLPQESAVYVQDVAQAVQTYDPRHYVILEGESPSSASPTKGDASPATITSYAYNEVYVDVDLAAPGWLILADSYFPGWRAYVRPRGAPESSEAALRIERHSGNFRAVLLDPGQHTVRFKYTPTSVKVGAFFSFLGGTILILMLVVWSWRRFVGSAGHERSDAQRVAKNSVAPLVLQLFNKTIDTAFMMLALRILSPQGAGQYYFVVTIVTYTDVFINFGLNIYLQREIAKARAESNRYLGSAILLRLGLCLLAAPLLALFVVLWPLLTRVFVSLGWAATYQSLAPNQIWALALFTAGLIPTNIAAALTALFQANERMEHPAAITVVSTIIKAGLGTAVLLAGWGIVGLGGVSIVTNLVTVAILLVLTVRLFFRPRFVFDRSLQREMARESWPLMINNLLSMAFFKADVLLIEAMRGAAVLGRYSVAYKLIDAINIIPSSFTFALFPLMSRFADSSKEAMHRAYTLAVRLLVIVALPLALALTTLAYPLAYVIGGSGYMPDSAIAVQLMIWSIPLGFVNSVTHYLLIALGRQRPLTVTFVVGLAFSIVANVVAIPIWGYRASAVIHILSELILLAAFYVLMRRDMPPVPWLSLLWRPGLAGTLMGVVGWLIYDVNKLLATVVALGAYVVALWVLGVAREPDMEVVRELIPLDRLRGLVQIQKH
jgi:O-antigen/teichoic acid export membrane protein